MIFDRNGTQCKKQNSQRFCRQSKLFYLLFFLSSAKGNEGFSETRPSRFRSENSFGLSGNQNYVETTDGPATRHKRQGPLQRRQYSVRSGPDSSNQQTAFYYVPEMGSPSSTTDQCPECNTNNQNVEQYNYDNQQTDQPQWDFLFPTASIDQQQIQDADQQQADCCDETTYEQQQQLGQNYGQQNYADEASFIGWLPNFTGDQYTDKNRIAETRALNQRFYDSIGGEPFQTDGGVPI